MRVPLTLAAALAFGACSLSFAPAWAQDTPTATQLEDMLVGRPAAKSRGIGAEKAKPGEASLTVPFASGSAEVSPAAAKVLDLLGTALMSPRLSGSKFRIEGHTDTVGRPEDNKVLSERRAASVAAYLAKKHGIDRARLEAVGMGQEGLMVDTGPNVAEAKNRRVLVVNLGG